MPNGGPMWHCYEMPDPHCASCNSTFVEMIESTEDDPRQFQTHAGPQDDGYPWGALDDDDPQHPQTLGSAPDIFQALLQGLASPGNRRGPGASTIRIDRRAGGPPSEGDGATGVRSGPTISFTTGGNGGGFLFQSGGVATGGGGGPQAHDLGPMFNTLFGGGLASPNGRQPGSPGAGSGNETGTGQAQGPGMGAPNLLRQILLGVFGGQAANGDGQFGDYAVTNEALDRIITELMEQSNADKPVPAPEDMIAKFPHSVVTEGSPLLQKDCAVCKDDFEITQKTIELPCKHSFHDDCILPWITQNGTCPVCRYELVPQPKHHGQPPQPPSPPSPHGGPYGLGGDNEAPSGSSANGGGGAGGNVGGGTRSGLSGLFSSLNMRGGASQRSTAQRQSSSQHVPGAWAQDDLD